MCTTLTQYVKQLVICSINNYNRLITDLLTLYRNILQFVTLKTYVNPYTHIIR
jgi:hypothetical protein